MSKEQCLLQMSWLRRYTWWSCSAWWSCSPWQCDKVGVRRYFGSFFSRFPQTTTNKIPVSFSRRDFHIEAVAYTVKRCMEAGERPQMGVYSIRLKKADPNSAPSHNFMQIRKPCYSSKRGEFVLAIGLRRQIRTLSECHNLMCTPFVFRRQTRTRCQYQYLTWFQLIAGRDQLEWNHVFFCRHC